LPLAGQCPQEHSFTLQEEDLAEGMELLPSDDLLQAVADVVNGHLPGYHFDPSREGFIIRGSNLVYYADKARLRDSKTIIYVKQTIGSVMGGNVIGVKTG
jgi:hypothetical protein